MQVSLHSCNRFVHSIGPSGNLFLLVMLHELRRQGLTFITFYVLQRVAKYPGVSQLEIRQETGLKDYEVSRDCKFLEDSGLITTGRLKKDGRVRVLKPTNRGKKVWKQVLNAASRQIQNGLSFDKGLSDEEEDRRLTQASESFEKGSNILFGPLQLSFLDTLPNEMNGRAQEKS